MMCSVQKECEMWPENGSSHHHLWKSKKMTHSFLWQRSLRKERQKPRISTQVWFETGVNSNGTRIARLHPTSCPMRNPISLNFFLPQHEKIRQSCIIYVHNNNQELPKSIRKPWRNARSSDFSSILVTFPSIICEQKLLGWVVQIPMLNPGGANASIL